MENKITSVSGDIITLDKDYEYENTFKSNGITISKSLTIDGQGHTINCNDYQGCLFYSIKGDVTLKNLIIKNSNNKYNKIGGVIFIRSAAVWTIINCTFENNAAEDYGGVIYNNVDETLTIINSTFINNKAKNEDGGAIFSKGDVVVEGSYFEGNNALVDAGAIFSEKSVDITECEFINNKAYGAKVHKCFGGAICAKVDVIARDSNFTGNSAENYGGAIYSHKDTIVSGCLFTGNTAKEGGAIYGNGLHVVVDNSTFIKNSANSNHGGAIHADKWLHVGNSTFENNTAKGKGGAIYTDFIKFDGEVNFIGNSARGHGGAIYTCTIADKIVGVVFKANHADSDYGGAIYINNKCGNVYLYNSTFMDNHAIAGDGGAIFSDSSSTKLILYNCTFNGNYADSGQTKRYGGAICSKGDISINNCTFNNNWAQNRGGAIYCYKVLSCEGNSYFKANKVYVDGGGAIYADKINEIKDTTFEACFSQGDGGAVYVDSACTTTVSKSYFKNNKANRGGAIYTDSTSSHIKLNNNAFVGNSAVNQGSDVFCSGYYDSIRNNWWGTNNPSFDNQLIEYKYIGSNKKHSDDSPSKCSLSCIDVGVNYMDSHFKITFTGGVPASLIKDVVFSCDKSGSFTVTSIKNNVFEFNFKPCEAGVYKITVKVNSQVFTYNLNVEKSSVFGEDFAKIYGKKGVYSAVFLDSNGNYLLEGTSVRFDVDGVYYNGIVHDNGVAELYANLDVGVHTVKSINTITGETFTNKITILPETKSNTYNINDTYVTRLVAQEEFTNGSTVTFTINGVNYISNVTSYGWAFFKLNVAPGNYVVKIHYNNVTVEDNITVLNQYSKVITHLNGTAYGSLLPVYNNESFLKLGNSSYSIIGENTYRYILPSLESFILYNVTVSNNDEFLNVLRKMSKTDYAVDVTVINFKKGTYKITENFWRDREWYYLIHLTHGKLFLNGNGATIEDDYHHNFIYGNPNTAISVNNLTLKTFYRCFVNNGELYCSNSTFVENNPIFFSTATPGGVAYNLNKATFDHCVFDNNKNSEPLVGWQSEEGTMGGVLYAEANSFTNFILCKFLSKHDNIRTCDKSAVVFYDTNDDVLDFHIKNSYLAMCSSVCLRDINSLNANRSYVFNYSDKDSLLNVHNDIKNLNNASGYVINLENKTYTISQTEYENMINERKEWRTKIVDPTIFYVPLKDRAILDMDSRAIVVNGNGAVIKLEDNRINNDYHFAYVPKHSSLTLINLTLSGFNSAILNYGTVFIVNCTFIGNSYWTVLDYSYGGAIKNYGGIYCYNSTFVNNSASKGAAIYSEGVSAQALFVNCSFSNNQIVSLQYALIKVEFDLHLTDNSVAKLVNCTGIGKYSIKTEDDGLFFIRDEVAPSVYNVVVDSVSSLMELSKLVSDNDEYDIINVTFVKGDYAVFPDSKILFEMDYGKLIINGAGARIFVQNPKTSDETQLLTTTIRSYVLITNLIVEGFNIAISNSGHLEIANSYFIKNKVDYKVKSDYGGAIVNSGTLMVLNTYFEGNYAKHGGAIYNTGSVRTINSTFKDNVDYNSKKKIDIYSHEGNLEIISLGSKIPNTTEHFPMTQWQEDLLESAIYAVTAVAVTWATYGTSSKDISHWISKLVGAAIGGAFGAVHGAIYSYSHQDYSTFMTKVFEGASHGLEFTDLGEAVSELPEPEKIDVFSKKGWIDILNNLLDEFVSRSWDFLSEMVDDAFFAGPPENEINVVYVPKII